MSVSSPSHLMHTLIFFSSVHHLIIRCDISNDDRSDTVRQTESGTGGDDENADDGDRGKSSTWAS